MLRRDRPAGKGYPRDQRVRGQDPSAGIAMAGNDTHDTRRNAGLFDELTKLQHRGRGMFRGLQNNRIARRQRRPILTAAKNSCEFHGTTAAATPSGSRLVKTNRSGLSIGRVSPLILSAQPA